MTRTIAHRHAGLKQNRPQQNLCGFPMTQSRNRLRSASHNQNHTRTGTNIYIGISFFFVCYITRTMRARLNTIV